MAAQEAQLDAISNNLANANTTGFKKTRADFQDLIYQTLRQPGSQTSQTTQSPTGLSVGTGVRLVSTSRQETQGALEQTGNSLDLAIEGNGLFVVQQPDGTPAYTRAGNLKTDSQGRLVTSEGLPLQPSIIIPPNAMGVDVSNDGLVMVRIQGQTNPVQVGQITLASFVNPAGLQALGHNLLIESAASGPPQLGVAGADGRGTILQGTLERSNVEVVQEMIGLIGAQRAYEINTKVISAADQMLQQATQLR